MEFHIHSEPSSADTFLNRLEIVEGSHPLWREIPPDRREAIRAFLGA